VSRAVTGAWRRVRRRAGVHARPDRDRGVVAVIVALLISTVLLTISAFAVDFGNALAERARLQAVADLAAKAGAVYLPDVTKARAAAVNTMCSTDNRAPDWASACAGAPFSLTDPLTTWVSNISFFGDDADGDHAPSPSELLTGAWATAISVTLPPTSVPVGLGQIAGVSSITVGSLGTARLATPMPALGVTPLYLVPTDLPGFGLPGGGAAAQVCFLFGGVTNLVPPLAGGAACNPPANPLAAQRGVVSEPHSGFTGTTTIRENFRTGIDHTIHAYPYWKCGGATAGLGGACLPLLPPAGATCATLPAGNIFSTSGGPVADVNCLGVDRDISGGTGEQREIRRGLLRISVAGRLQQPTCGGTVGTVHGYANADNNDLFRAGQPWVNPALTQADLDSAKAAMIAGQPNPLPVRPFTARIFNCARFTVAPILPEILPLTSPLTFLPVVGFRYLWIGSDNEPASPANDCTSTENGLIWRTGFGCGGRTTTLVGVRAYVFDLSYLPQAPYLGPDLASVSGLANNPPT
jgi:Flp pilus assembly protein TadG